MEIIKGVLQSFLVWTFSLPTIWFYLLIFSVYYWFNQQKERETMVGKKWLWIVGTLYFLLSQVLPLLLYAYI